MGVEGILTETYQQVRWRIRNYNIETMRVKLQVALRTLFITLTKFVLLLLIYAQATVSMNEYVDTVPQELPRSEDTTLTLSL